MPKKPMMGKMLTHFQGEQPSQVLAQPDPLQKRAVLKSL